MGSTVTRRARYGNRGGLCRELHAGGYGLSLGERGEEIAGIRIARRRCIDRRHVKDPLRVPLLPVEIPRAAAAERQQDLRLRIPPRERGLDLRLFRLTGDLRRFDLIEEQHGNLFQIARGNCFVAGRPGSEPRACPFHTPARSGPAGS